MPSAVPCSGKPHHCGDFAAVYCDAVGDYAGACRRLWVAMVYRSSSQRLHAAAFKGQTAVYINAGAVICLTPLAYTDAFLIVTSS